MENVRWTLPASELLPLVNSEITIELVEREPHPRTGILRKLVHHPDAFALEVNTKRGTQYVSFVCNALTMVCAMNIPADVGIVKRGV